MYKDKEEAKGRSKQRVATAAGARTTDMPMPWFVFIMTGSARGALLGGRNEPSKTHYVGYMNMTGARRCYDFLLGGSTLALLWQDMPWVDLMCKYCLLGN